MCVDACVCVCEHVCMHACVYASMCGVYVRACVQVDTMIVQAIGLLDDLDKELNTYAMRVREW